jgi:hypothetical protein
VVNFFFHQRIFEHARLEFESVPVADMGLENNDIGEDEETLEEGAADQAQGNLWFTCEILIHLV